MRNDFESDYLAHHGILGQKWGKKNGPPYPLDSGQKSAAEKSKEDEHKRQAIKYAKRAATVGAAAAVIGGVTLAQNKGLIKIGNEYVKTFLVTSKASLPLGLAANLAFAGANYAMYKHGIKNNKTK